jgi:VWFA-related protein
MWRDQFSLYLRPSVLSAFLYLSANEAYAQRPRFEAEVDLVLSDVAVLDGVTSKPIVNLNKEDFVLTDNDEEREISFLHQGVEGLDVILLLDTSSSQAESRENYADAVSAAVESLWLQDQVAVMSFASKPRVVAPFSSDQKEVDEALRQVARSRRRSMSANIYGALEAAVKLFPVQRRDPRRRKVILIVTHNEQARDRKESAAITRRLIESDVTLHGVVVERVDLRPGVTSRNVLGLPGGPVTTEKRIPTKWVPRPDRHTIDPIVNATGGELVREGVPMGEFLKVALTKFRLQYVLGFHGSREVSQGNPFHRLHIELTAAAKKRYPDAIIRHRQGYFTAGSRQ